MPVRLNGATSGYTELSAPAVAGITTMTMPTASGTLDRLERAGNILQVVNANTSTGVTNSLATYIDTGLSATITPTSTTSKILVLVNQTSCFKNGANTWLLLKLFRDTTDISSFDSVVGYTNSTAENTVGTSGCCFLDSPNTTSSTTYSTKFANQTGTGQVGVQRNSSMSTITLLEIAE